MVDETLYITPHEAALAVVATAMKKARLRLDTLIINSIIGGVLFSAGGMLHLCVQAENPLIWASNPGMVHLMQGLVYPIGLFYVIVMGAELFNSNVLYFSVALCRGAVSIFDLLISWFFSWLFNLGANLFVCYVICHLSGVTQGDLYKQGAIDIAMAKDDSTFIETFIKGCAANFCVCLAVYLQLLAKPYHVKLLLMGLPIFTFVTMGFNHVVADMYLVPMGMIEGAPIPVGVYVWKILIGATLGNAVGGSIFGIVIPFYLHLVVVERDRDLLNLPKFEARDEQPELEMDSRVVRVPAHALEVNTESSDSESGEKYSDQIDPIPYRPPSIASGSQLNPTMSISSRSSHLSRRTSHNARSPPGVFPVMGMGAPLTRERTIANGTHITSNSSDNQSIYSRDDRSIFSTMTRNRKEIRDQEKEEEDEYIRFGGYNARENAPGETLKRVITRAHKPAEASRSQDIEMGLSKTFDASDLRASNNSSGVLRSLQRTFSLRNPDTSDELHDRLRRHSITRIAANASDNIAGIDNYDFDDIIKKPPPAQRKKSHQSAKSSVPLSPIQSEHNSSEEDIPKIDEGIDPLETLGDPGSETSSLRDDQGSNDAQDQVSSLSSDSREERDANDSATGN